MIVYYQKPAEYNLNIEAFIKFLMEFYTDVEGNHWDKLNFQDEDVVGDFLADLGDNTDWYLEKFGCEVCELFSDESLDEICNEVIFQMEEAGIIKSI